MLRTSLFIAIASILWGQTALAQDHYMVRQGDNLTIIAKNHSLTVSDFLVANGQYLIEKTAATCSRKPKRYTESTTRRGYFCNTVRTAKDPVHANTLVAGWRLAIPRERAPDEVQKVVATSTGKRVALVVDATGSMGGNIQRVADEYRAALRSHGRDIIGVWLFADNRVWQVRADQLTSLPTNGSVENTYAALLEAQKAGPDTTILITDEPGDDWPRDGRFARLAPVIALCLPQQGVGPYTCETTLRKLVTATPGSRYVQGIAR